MSGISLTIAISIGYIALAYIRIYEVQTWILSSVITVIGVFLLFIISVQIEQHQCEKKLWMLFGDYGMDIYMIGYYVQQAIYVIVGKILGCNYLIYAWLMLILGLIVPVILSKYIVRKSRVLLMLVLGR